MEIKCKRLSKTAKIPKHSRPGDAALDLHADESIIIPAKGRSPINTGIMVEIPQGYWGSFRDRGGLAFNHGLTVLAGVLDSNYRGELKVVLFNTSDNDYQVSAGDRIAQMIVMRHETAELIEAENLSDSARAEQGFGSSGK